VSALRIPSRARRALMAAITPALVVTVAACGSSSSSSSVTSAPPIRTGTTTSPPVASTSTTSVTNSPVVHRRPRPRSPDPGTLPQTDVLPSADAPGFHARMAALWRGVQTGRTAPALPAFFPKSAYLQVKTVGDPAADWLYRLVADYGLDIEAAHALLGPDPPSARLLTVTVEKAYAHWVPPGVCDNRVGYYEVPHSRVVYRAGGEVRSFGIASMISWRGVWYVVHLGSVLRPVVTGMVDNPQVGPGAPVPSSTC
jgi:hypothetical protein